MATNILLPQWGMNMEDGLLVKWLVKQGDSVELGQPLVEVETAKIDSELEAPMSGVVAHILASEGTTVSVGTIIAVIGKPGETVPRPSPTATTGSTIREENVSITTSNSERRTQVTPVAQKLARQEKIDLCRVQGTGPNGRITEENVRAAIMTKRQTENNPAVQVVPQARKLAADHGIDLGQVQGTGPNQRILVADIKSAIQDATAAQITAREAPPGKVVALTGLRKTIAQRMMESVNSMAQVTVTTEVDMTEAVKLRESLVAQWRKASIRPLDLDLIIKAVAESLKEHPRLNATLASDEIHILDHINVGTAMAVPNGLMVPVIRLADKKDLLSIAKEVRDLANKSRKDRLSVKDVTGASFTITSLANYEIDAFTPIINPPQVAILGVGRIAARPTVHQDKVVVRSIMVLSLSFDHRVLDGVSTGEFLRTLKGNLEDPEWMLGTAANLDV